MIINAAGVQQGVYSLVLESIDSASDIKPEIALKTDTVTIYVTEYVRNVPVVSFIVITKESIGLLSVEHIHSTIPLPYPL